MSLVDDIKAFQERFGQAYNGPPRTLPRELDTVRQRKLGEEFKEILMARASSDYVAMFDGYIDLVYVAIGTALMHGFDFQEGWNRVHEANMTKIRSGYDIIKPPGFIAPNLRDLVFKKKVANESDT
jgi:predicted HAD superfamily Cof-like phosphohydrolase